MDVCVDIPDSLEVHPLGLNGEMDIVPATDNFLCTSSLPCGLPPILPDSNTVLRSFIEDIDKLPIFHVDAVQRFVPGEPNVHSLYEPEPCSLQTELAVRRDVTTGKLLGFIEQEKASICGTTKTSMSLSRAPGPPEFGIKGSSSSFPFWPGGMDEPWAQLVTKEPLDASLFDGEYLETPPGFKNGLTFDRKKPSVGDVTLPSLKDGKICLSDVLAMEDLTDFATTNDQEDNFDDDVDLSTAQRRDDTSNSADGVDSDLLKIENFPVLNISEAKTVPISEFKTYKWAVTENVLIPVEDFHEKIPDMAFKWDFELDTFQKKAILHLEKQENVFVAAHTSAGKTVVAEYAIALAKRHMTRVIYTSPIKALSNQKFREFKDAFGDVGLITGDVQINETAFCLIMTTEILRSMLYHGSDVLREVEWVIFDEVHYINDAERGVVWEEVFIMLPQHVNLIMLSATVPNTAEFADWLGSIKKRKIYVISTLKRPTPLVHHLYTGSTGVSEDNNFSIVDSDGNFLNHMYAKAVQSKETKNKATSGAKGPRQNVTAAQEKNAYISLLGYLKKKDLLPVICFTLSRKRCNEHGMALLSQDLTTNEEKSKIRAHFNHSISKLKDDDKKLRQVKIMKEQLLNGFGVHHSGILPILKEVVEMLFQKGLVKVLFATETFAMGVNMPARTVVFDSIRKHDGREFRDLQPSEYIQMAGRAGRRGKDKIGTVMILCKGDVPDSESLKRMMMGKATMLTSQFKLTYSMILNLLKVKTLRVEDVMKCSFGESGHQKQQKSLQQELSEAKEKLDDLVRPDCPLCGSDLEAYCQLLQEMNDLKTKVMKEVCLQAIGTRILSVGRVVSFVANDAPVALGLVLSVDKEKLRVLTQLQTNDKEESFARNLRPAVMTVCLAEVHTISNKTLKVDAEYVLNDWRKMELLKCNPGQAISTTFEVFKNFCNANKKGLTSYNFTFRDLDLSMNFLHLQKLHNSLDNFTCIKCPEFSEHSKVESKFLALQSIVQDLTYKLSEESLVLHDEYKSRKKVLHKLGYIDSHDIVQLKGSVAREMSNHELLITELMVKGEFSSCNPAEIAALLSCMVFQQKCKEDLLHVGVIPSLMKKIKVIKQVVDDIDQKQKAEDIQEPEFADQYNFHLTQVVYEWAKGVTFAHIMNTIPIEVEEGIIVRCIQRLCELLKDLKKASTLVGDPVLAEKMADASALIKRDIVFAASLYTQ